MAFHSLTALAFLAPLQSPPPGQDPHAGHDHADFQTFEEALEHRSFTHLVAWKEKHPWELGGKVHGLLGRLVDARRGADPVRIETAQISAAFLAEALADDPNSAWLVSLLEWDIERTARYDTLREAIDTLPGAIGRGEADEAWEQIAFLRKEAAPPGGWWMCAPALAGIAESLAEHGHPARADELARELGGLAESARWGEILLWSEGFQARAARARADLESSAGHFERTMEIARQLPGPALQSAFDAWLERTGARLPAAGLDTFVQYALGEEQTLALVASRTGRAAKLLPTGRASIEALARPLCAAMQGSDGRARDGGTTDPVGVQGRDLRALPFDVAAARTLYDALVRPLEPYLGSRVAIAPDGALWNVSFDLLVSGGEAGKEDPARPYAHLRGLRFLVQDRALATAAWGTIAALRERPPGKEPSVTAPWRTVVWIPAWSSTRSDSWAEITALGNPSAPVFGPSTVLDDPSLAELREHASGASYLHIAAPCFLDTARPVASHFVIAKSAGEESFASSDRRRLETAEMAGLELAARLVVVSECLRLDAAAGSGGSGSSEAIAHVARAFRTAGADEIVANLWNNDDDSKTAWMRAFYLHLCAGEPPIDAARAAKLEILAGDDPRGFSRAHPYFWAGWVVQR